MDAAGGCEGAFLSKHRWRLNLINDQCSMINIALVRFLACFP
jgi:hypothetical protein